MLIRIPNSWQSYCRSYHHFDQVSTKHFPKVGTYGNAAIQEHLVSKDSTQQYITWTWRSEWGLNWSPLTHKTDTSIASQKLNWFQWTKLGYWTSFLKIAPEIRSFHIDKINVQTKVLYHAEKNHLYLKYYVKYKNVIKHPCCILNINQGHYDCLGLHLYFSVTVLTGMIETSILTFQWCGKLCYVVLPPGHGESGACLVVGPHSAPGEVDPRRAWNWRLAEDAAPIPLPLSHLSRDASPPQAALQLPACVERGAEVLKG